MDTALSNSPVELIRFQGRKFFLKRDDTLHEEFSGNKARKLLHFIEKDFPDITKLISYGSPQANSLHALSALARLKGWSFDFYVARIPKNVKANPLGNYRAALDLGANLIEAGTPAKNQKMESCLIEEILPAHNNALFIPEGGRCKEAAYGIKGLADEIISWRQTHYHPELKVVLPSGTGTTALFLQQHFKEKNVPIEVLTCACVGGDSYLTQQFDELTDNELVHPTIMPTTKKYHFGKLYKEFFDIWQKLLIETNVEFDLLYDPLGWLTLSNYIDTNDVKHEWTILYIHQGGLLGNETMLPRYKRRFGSLV